VYTEFSWEHRGKNQLERSKRRREYNIKIDLQAVKWGMEWIDLAEDITGMRALVNTVMNISCSIKCGQFLD
jgi:hypothetical protein